MSVSRNHFIEIAADVCRAGDSIDAFVDRLRSVRDRVGRWVPRADRLNGNVNGVSAVFRAAVRLDSAVEALDARVNGDGQGCPSEREAAPTVQALVHAVEARATELESILVDAAF